MPSQSLYPQNSNPIAPSWMLAQYTFPEVPSGYCIEKATYLSQFTLAPDASIFNQEMPIDRTSDFIWNEWRFAQVLLATGTYPNIKVRLRDSRGRRITNDFIDIPQACGMLFPLTLVAGSSLFIDATADDSATTTLSFQVVFKGFKRWRS